MTRIVLVLFVLASSLVLGSCSGCSSNPPTSQTATPARPTLENGEAPPPGIDEGADSGPTDEIETPEDQSLTPSTEPDINE